MDERYLLLLMRVFGNKLYELQTGFAAMFNLCIQANAFSEEAFHGEMRHLENLTEFRKLRAVLDKLNKPTEREDLESLLREYEGPVQ